MYHRHTYRDDIAGPVWLYRLFCGQQLLYVGISSRLSQRLVSHRSKPWGGAVDRIELQRFATRAEGFAAERAAILAEKPVHNRARPIGATA